PRTLAQEGANRTVQHDASDRLCFDGRRLLVGPGALYGATGSEYRTEVDQFDRIVLTGDMSSWSSYFQVEHKSGRVSQFAPVLQSGTGLGPDVWYLVREFDRQGNCIVYNYITFALRGADPERL